MYMSAELFILKLSGARRNEEGVSLNMHTQLVAPKTPVDPFTYLETNKIAELLRDPQEMHKMIVFVAS